MFGAKNSASSWQHPFSAKDAEGRRPAEFPGDFGRAGSLTAELWKMVLLRTISRKFSDEADSASDSASDRMLAGHEQSRPVTSYIT